MLPASDKLLFNSEKSLSNSDKLFPASDKLLPASEKANSCWPSTVHSCFYPSNYSLFDSNFSLFDSVDPCMIVIVPARYRRDM